MGKWSVCFVYMYNDRLCCSPYRILTCQCDRRCALNRQNMEISLFGGKMFISLYYTVRQQFACVETGLSLIKSNEITYRTNLSGSTLSRQFVSLALPFHYGDRLCSTIIVGCRKHAKSISNHRIITSSNQWHRVEWFHFYIGYDTLIVWNAMRRVYT